MRWGRCQIGVFFFHQAESTKAGAKEEDSCRLGNRGGGRVWNGFEEIAAKHTIRVTLNDDVV